MLILPGMLAEVLTICASMIMEYRLRHLGVCLGFSSTPKAARPDAYGGLMAMAVGLELTPVGLTEMVCSWEIRIRQN